MVWSLNNLFYSLLSVSDIKNHSFVRQEKFIHENSEKGWNMSTIENISFKKIYEL